ncbi:MAG: PBP1A family penicillin-binding protein [Anaerolineae bacterium]
MWWLFFGLLFGVFFFVPFGLVFGTVFTAYARALSILPTPEATISRDPVIGATEIYDNSGLTLLFAVQDPLADERQWLTLDELPDYVEQATLLWEDPAFLQNGGFDVVDTVDRLVSNWLAGPVEAPPSLTRRLVRNVILPPDDRLGVGTTGETQATPRDSAIEIALVAEINRLYTPERVLEWHLNTNYYGNEAYGIEAAAQVYLGKSARDLTLDEAVLLAAIPTAPRFNPVDDETAARGRQADLLRQMLTNGMITQSAFEAAIANPTRILPDAGQKPLVAPEFAIYARRQAERLLSDIGLDGAQLVSRGGLRITTTLDLDLYFQAECTLRVHTTRLAGGAGESVTAQDGTPCYGAAYLPAIPAASGAPPDTGTIIILDARTGEVRAMVGEATRAQYQPGGTLHPFVYLDGFLRSGYTAATMLLDIPRDFPGAEAGLLYLPNNPDGQFRGPLSLREAMAVGLLPPVVEVANVRNLNTIIRNTIRDMGISSLREGAHDLSLMDRGGTVSVMEMTYAYSIFASLGKGMRQHTPIAIRQIEDAQGNVLWAYNTTEQAARRIDILQAEVAYLVDDILSDQSTRRATFGLDNPLEMTRPVAAVNTITSNRQDNWTIGYTPQVVTGVRLGRLDGTALGLEDFGLDGAAQVWRAVMEYVHLRDNLPAENWPRPANIAQTQVCVISGMSPNGVCSTRPEIFLTDSQFPPEDTYWRSIRVNTQRELLATANTPASLVEQRAYFIPPDAAMDWWRANKRPLPPEQSDTLSRADIFSSAAILQPENWAYVGGQVDIRGSINTEQLQYYQLDYGSGISPDGWLPIAEQVSAFTPGTSLGIWNTTGLDGTYTLRLQVALQDNTIETATVQVIVDNIPPQVVLTAGELGQVYRWPEDDVIPLVAEVRDLKIDRVEFYHNGLLVAERREFPYDYNHPINRAGIETFRVVAFDSVGNSQAADLNVEVVREGG